VEKRLSLEGKIAVRGVGGSIQYERRNTLENVATATVRDKPSKDMTWYIM